MFNVGPIIFDIFIGRSNKEKVKSGWVDLSLLLLLEKLNIGLQAYVNEEW